MRSYYELMEEDMSNLHKRPPPAYQEYASSMLANYDFRALSLEARGVLYTLRLECWANKRLPSDPLTLSKALGIEMQQIVKYTPELKPFFKIEDGWLFSPELDNYRSHLDHRRERQSDGGKKGAAKANAQRKADGAEVSVTPRDTRDSLVKLSQLESSKAKKNTAINERISLDYDWVEDFQKTRYK